jgi:hypothetical protein
MMEEANAKLLRVDTESSSPAGKTLFEQGSDLDVDCAFDVPSSGQKYILGAMIKDCSAVLYVEHADLPAGVVIAQGQRLLVQPMGREAALWLVEIVRDRVADVLGHDEIFLRKT